MSKIIFILGGARSGKSRFAVNLAKKTSKKVAFIATCLPLDNEMKRRVALHKCNRPKHWKTFENPRGISLLLKEIGLKFNCIIIDCLTLMVSNLILKGSKEPSVKAEINKILNTLKKIKAQSIIVSNEVGLGIVPANKLSRDFRDIAGKMNQIVAGVSNEVFFMASGIPIRIKGRKNG